MNTELYNQFASELNIRGIRPTLQRLTIFQYLYENRIHPTADMIYESLKDKFPTFSKATVYNTLNLFRDKGVLTELLTYENEARYDINTAPHAHFYCIECGELSDINIDEAIPRNQKFQGHLVLEYQVLLKGICANCEGKMQHNH